MINAILTIDDTPSAQTDELTEFLKARNVPAILFCRGDRLFENPAPAKRAVERGFILANHAWSHTRFSTLSYEEGIDEILRTDALIDEIYKDAGFGRNEKYFRFPHLDRGAGGWIVDYDAAGVHKDTLIRLFADGLNISLDKPAPEMVEKKARLQDFLRAEGFAPPDMTGAPAWYADTEMAQALDWLYDFSTSDWMVTPRHAGKWPYKTLGDLKAKIDLDENLRNLAGPHIILAHDQDGLFPVVGALIDHMLNKGFKFHG